MLKALRLDCPGGRNDPESFACPEGRLRLDLPLLRRSVNACYRLTLNPHVQLQLDPLRFARGKWRLRWSQRESDWRLDLQGRQPLALAWLRPLLPPSLQGIEDLGGNLHLQASGRGRAEAQYWQAKLTGGSLHFHDSDYARVLDQVGLRMRLQASRKHADWHGTLDLQLDQGEGLWLPFYWNFAAHPFRFSGQWRWRPRSRSLLLQDFRLRQTGIWVLGGSVFKYTPDNGINTRGDLTFHSRLPALFDNYLKPLLEGGNWEGLTVVTGWARGQVRWRNGPRRARLALERLTLDDRQRRLGLNRLQAELYWQRSLDAGAQAFPTSRLAWHAGHLYAIPFGAAGFLLRLVDDDIRLLRPATIPVLDGRLRIRELEILDLTRTPRLRFAGDLKGISLEVLTRVLGLPPLAGTLDGHIPKVTYDHRRHTLKVDGRLVIEVFDGRIVVENLVVTDLFGALPRLRADIYLHDLDLEQVTGHFSFGRITGRLEGYVKDLQLENWRPVAFDAWFGTPGDDRSRKRISQKAVENLTTLGGGSAVGVLSRLVLRLFDEFHYRRLGLGCRLRYNVCELRGIAAAPQGFYIVQGSYLPRIDVIGYNRRIDWPTLIARLKRITQVQGPVIR
ncbi:hypothetical protein MIT9_P1499 [Methylomarinovum caldicuralii]|uniref:AsmA-like C-terminal domain-containing protein n=1 Tax=Methylomarinovum caldicuralii TaxID=438856 RepID=A0AAU9C0S3_9GAMM|nr:hypothetical protein [Methylomarinovum caldicuralii]BCX81917.1 hypothetical protein MIT9_P1499 [Methylomarinovum caldicuralii]